MPSFEEYTAIKDMLVRNRSHPTGSTPLAEMERQQKTLQEYEELEE